MSFRNLSFQSLHLRTNAFSRSPIRLQQSRPFTQTQKILYPRKDVQDKDTIDTNATEYSKSGSDDAASHLDETAFNADITSPEGQEKQAGKKEDGSYTADNPLNVSPANKDVSKGKSPTEGGAEKGEGQKASGGGSPDKGKKVR